MQSPENILAMQHHHTDQLQFSKAEPREAFPSGPPAFNFEYSS